jgi:hypothetical protein
MLAAVKEAVATDRDGLATPGQGGGVRVGARHDAGMIARLRTRAVDRRASRLQWCR